MIEVILDTNFLMIPGRFKVDIFSELDRLISSSFKMKVTSGTLSELKLLTTAADKGADKRAAMLGLSLIDTKIASGELLVIEQDESILVDDFLVEYALIKKEKDNFENKVFVATQDSDLKSRLAEIGVSVIVLRQQKYLKFVGS